MTGIITRLEYGAEVSERIVQVLDEMQDVEGEHRIVATVCWRFGARWRDLEADIRGTGLREALACDADHGGGDVGGGEALHMTGKPQRSRAGAATGFQHVAEAADHCGGAFDRCLVTGRVGDGAGGVLAGDPVPEAGVGVRRGGSHGLRGHG
jgi:hypothetical protein